MKKLTIILIISILVWKTGSAQKIMPNPKTVKDSMFFKISDRNLSTESKYMSFGGGLDMAFLSQLNKLKKLDLQTPQHNFFYHDNIWGPLFNLPSNAQTCKEGNLECISIVIDTTEASPGLQVRIIQQRYVGPHTADKENIIFSTLNLKYDTLMHHFCFSGSYALCHAVYPYGMGEDLPATVVYQKLVEVMEALETDLIAMNKKSK